jgi:hypothetical protein
MSAANKRAVSKITGIYAYRVSTAYLEQRAGMLIWGNLTGPDIDKEKSKIRSMWT